MERRTNGRSTGWPLTIGLVALAAAGCGRVAFEPIENAAPIDAGLGGEAITSLCAGPRLVAHWPLDELTGTVIVDTAGTNDGVWTDTNDGTVANEAMTGRRGGALRFDTGSSAVMPGFVVPTTGTFSAWLTSGFNDSTAPGGNHPMVFDAPTPRSTISYAADIGAYGVRTNDVSWQATFSSPTDLTGWFHLAATWSATGAQLYLDGVPAGAPGVTDARSTSPAGLYLGTREQGARWWTGLIDDVRFYDYAMTADDVTELYGCP